MEVEAAAEVAAEAVAVVVQYSRPETVTMMTTMSREKLSKTKAKWQHFSTKSLGSAPPHVNKPIRAPSKARNTVYHLYMPQSLKNILLLFQTVSQVLHSGLPRICSPSVAYLLSSAYGTNITLRTFTL